MTTLSQNIVGRIRQEHIAPVPRWHFLLRSYVFWGLLAVSMLLGSLSFSVIVHLISVGDLDTLKYLQGNVFTSTVLMLPYFWFFSLMLFGSVAYYNWKHTKLGYRFKRRWIFFASVTFSVLFGSILYALGMGNAVDRVMAKAMPFYDQSRHKARNEIWVQPKNGLIMGKVLEVDSASNQIVIQDVQGKDWSIDENAVSPAVSKSIVKGKIIKIIGKQDGENNFVAKEIRKCVDCQDDEEQNAGKVNSPTETNKVKKIETSKNKDSSDNNQSRENRGD